MICGMSVGASSQLFYEYGSHKKCGRQFKSSELKELRHLSIVPLSSRAWRQDSWSLHVSDKIYKSIVYVPPSYNVFTCRSFAVPSSGSMILLVKNTKLALTRTCNTFLRDPLVSQLVPAIGIIAFAAWGLSPLLRSIRSLFQNDSNWKKSKTYYISTSYLQPLLLWTGATLICRVLDPVTLPSDASQAVKQRVLNFVRSLSTVLAFAYCLTSLIQQTHKAFIEASGTDDTRRMGYEFAGKAIYTAVWVAAVSLFMELLGFSTQKWLTAGGLGTVLLTLAGREIFTNFLSSVMIHATRPFVLNEWIQTKIEGYEVSGTVEHVGWWSPTIIRGDDREAVHIPNHKFTVNVVRNLSQKTHWRIKTHLAISHLDVNKISNIVADMRKVLAKNPQIEQQKLHRRVFLDNIDPENQALLVLVSCFVRTSHFEEYLCVKEAVLLDLLRVISHHRARLATPIRTVQRVYTDPEITNIPFAESVVNRAAASANRPYLLIGPTGKINGDEKTKPRSSSRTNEDQSGKGHVPEVKAATSEGAGLNNSDKQEEKKGSSTGDAQHKTKKTDPVEAPSSSLPSTTDPEKSETAGADIKGTDQKAPSSEGVDEQRDSAAPPAQVKNDPDRAPASTAAARSAYEDNIVLGVALEGSKRTLPIEEGMGSSATQLEGNELAAGRAGNGSPTSPKDKKVSGTGDHRDQER